MVCEHQKNTIMRLKMGRTSMRLEVMKPRTSSFEKYGYHPEKHHGWHG